MAEPSPPDVTVILGKISRGEVGSDELIPVVYEELRRMAARQMTRESSAVTLSPTALVHEAYLKLAGGGAEQTWENRRHFFAGAARAMRQVLVDRARRRAGVKHGGDRKRVALDEEAMLSEPPAAETLALDGALTKLEAQNPRRAEIVLLRFFAGLSIEETASAMSLSPATVKNEWAFARAWLRREVETAGEV